VVELQTAPTAPTTRPASVVVTYTTELIRVSNTNEVNCGHSRVYLHHWVAVN
jgi:hypothetical protein